MSRAEQRGGRAGRRKAQQFVDERRAAVEVAAVGDGRAGDKARRVDPRCGGRRVDGPSGMLGRLRQDGRRAVAHRPRVPAGRAQIFQRRGGDRIAGQTARDQVGALEERSQRAQWQEARDFRNPRRARLELQLQAVRGRVDADVAGRNRCERAVA